MKCNYAKDDVPMADYRILDTFESHLQSPGLNYGNFSIGIKTKMAHVLKSG